MKFINVNDWMPADGIILEESALCAIKQSGNVSVMAGPGAGKTELLAQKAGFLFETGECKPRKKILAISFKVDAAKNLEERVKKRYGKEISMRFESKTFDSFAKGLLDQFKLAIPEDYRPKKNYDLILTEKEINRIIKENLVEQNPYHPNWKYEYSETVLNKKLTEERLPIGLIESDLYSWLVNKSWSILTKGTNFLNSSLTFPMISIIVDYLLRSNLQLIKAIRSTYTHIFLDEFQDTTHIQYNLLKTLFSNSNVSITAVGDEKQRIMGWAGAIDNAFKSFKEDFSSKEYILINNFRSAPELVRIQNIFSQTISEHTLNVNSAGKWDKTDGICEVWVSENHVKEGETIAHSIQNWMEEDKLMPKDFCIIVKQQEHVYGKAIISSLDKLGIHSRLEKEYQDLLADECIRIIMSIIELSFSEKNLKLWLSTLDFLIKIKGKSLDGRDTVVLNKLENSLLELTLEVKKNLKMVEAENCEHKINEIIESILEFIDLKDLKSSFPKYNQSGLLKRNIEKFFGKIVMSYKRQGDWIKAINDLNGKYSIPIMTIHKSKGLEYNTVLFVGLEDSAFWSFKSQAESDKKAFFVALSRAKKRIIFTFSRNREVLNYGTLTTKKQSLNNISEVYYILESAGVPIKEF
ncbi:ATP-dependent helicase [Exiguobacterium sp. TBG-PICH-001]|uniref:UvrD-helicase domain-containing protein n=1 Tax=Exiguobacterium abrahamii TaxID=2785532 RepID=UPI0018A76877|nr:ATP-dependent helicase [Exiguobacterium sp. TBG-PICH-001]MBF8152060.1 ATP-dependent helicase [Exiguobacterium sp. TBG-PICH-001]